MHHFKVAVSDSLLNGLSVSYSPSPFPYDHSLYSSLLVCFTGAGWHMTEHQRNHLMVIYVCHRTREHHYFFTDTLFSTYAKLKARGPNPATM